MSDFPPSPIEGGPFATAQVAYAIREADRIVYQLFVGTSVLDGTSVIGYTRYDANTGEAGVWVNMQPSLPSFDAGDDAVYAFWRLPGDLLDDDYLVLLHAESSSILPRVRCTLWNATTATFDSSFTLTSEGDGTSFLTQHPQIMALPPTEGPSSWYIISFAEGGDNMSAFELSHDSVNFSVTEHMYNTSSGVGTALSRWFTFRSEQLDLFVSSAVGVPTLTQLLLSHPWDAPVVGATIIEPLVGIDSANVLDVLMVQHEGVYRLLACVQEFTGPAFINKTYAWDDEEEETWTIIYKAVHLQDDFTDTRFRSYAALDETPGLASSPHVRGNTTVLMTEDAGYTIFCFGPGEYHNIDALGAPIHASSITYDFFLRHALDENLVPQTQYFVDQGLDEFCRPIATVRYV